MFKLYLVALLILTSLAIHQVEVDPFDCIPMNSVVNLTMTLSFDETKEEDANWPEDREVTEC